MNERLIEALMKLFAIVANVSKEGKAKNDRDIVLDYLMRHFSNEYVKKYLDYFNKSILRYHPNLNGNQEDIKKQELYNAWKLNELCDQLNLELQHEQKLIVFVHLIDFINRGEEFSNKEEQFIRDVAENLKIDEKEYLDIIAFSLNQLNKINYKEHLLIINSGELPSDKKIKHIKKEKLDGHIVVLHIPSSNTFIFRYNGRDNLFLNGHNIKCYRSYIWSMGSVIKNQKIGSVYYTWIAGKFIQASVKHKFVFTASDIEYSYGNSPHGIKPFTFTEESGRLIGIIGGSGSGKSTLLKVLNGNIKPKKGSIEINGFNIHEHHQELEGIIGYVPQDDFLIKELTVYQNLYYNARLCFSHFNEGKIHDIVEKSLVSFDLVEARDLEVGNEVNTFLSGGQRKRLNIALELMREPSVLFVDEPTSGLSSMDSEKVMNLLKRQTFKGKLIIANIHQPSSDTYKLLDKILVLDQGGRVIFYGNPVDAILYFKRINHYVDAEESECLTCGNISADQILRNVEARVVDVNGRLTRKRKTSPEEWYQLYLKNIDPIIQKIKRPYSSALPESLFKIPPRFKQFKVFFIRDLLAKLKNKQYMLINLIEAPLLALILAFFSKSSILGYNETSQYIFGENANIPAYLFMAVIVALFMGLVISAEEIFKDRKILEREKFLNLSRSSYLNAKILILFLISIIQTSLFVLIGNYILEIKGMDWRHFMILFSTACWANMIGLNISAGFNSVVTIYILVPLILVPQLLFSGVVIDFQNMNKKVRSVKYVPLIGDIITSRWAYESMVVTQYRDNRFEKHFFNAEKDISNAMYTRAYLIPEIKNILQKTYLKGNSEKNADNIILLNNELTKLSNNNPLYLLNEDEKRISTRKYQLIRKFLDLQAAIQFKNYKNAIETKEKKYQRMVEEMEGNDKFIEYKNNYHNKKLSALVHNQLATTELVRRKNELIRIKDPVFNVPDSRFGRAHFYAPVKRIGNYEIDTFWFNILFVWLYTTLFYLILYFDLLHKLIIYVENFRLNRLNRRIFKFLTQEEFRSRRKKARTTLN